MSEQERLQAWIRQRLDAAVQELGGSGVFEGMLIEAKPAWVLPFQILIGRAREQGETSAFRWFVCGELPTDHIDSTAAATPRDAARHFAIKWQLDATRKPDSPDAPSDDPGSQLAETAEALYALVDDESLWQQKSSS